MQHLKQKQKKLNANRNQSQRLPPHTQREEERKEEGEEARQRPRWKLSSLQDEVERQLEGREGPDVGAGIVVEGPTSNRRLHWYFKHCQAHNQNA